MANPVVAVQMPISDWLNELTAFPERDFTLDKMLPKDPCDAVQIRYRRKYGPTEALPVRSCEEMSSPLACR